MSRLGLHVLAIVCFSSTLAFACSSGGAGRPVDIAQTDDGCTPQQISATRGEKLTLQIHNNGRKDHEVEGTGGTKLEELLVPAGKTRNAGYTVPNRAGTQQIKCYIAGGSTTIISVTAN